MKICPHCQERLKPDAILCTHCGRQLEPIPAVAADGSRPTPDRRKIGCAIIILLAVALLLWAFSTFYQAQSPEGAAAVKGPSEDRGEGKIQGR